MAGTAGKWRTGKGMRLSVGGTILNILGINISQAGQDFDTTNSESLAPEGTVGFTDLTVRIEANWDASKNAFDNPPNLNTGTILTTVIAFINQVDNTFLSMPSARVTDSELPIRIRDLVKFNWTMKGHGTYTLPTGSV